MFRCDISRPEWQRDSLDGVLDYNVVGGAMRQYPRIVMDRKEANGEIVVEYGSSNGVEASNVQPVGWAIDAWSRGADGILPWQTVGTNASWKKADSLSLFYPGRDAKEGPSPSIRLKAYRRGQQDVEYLTLLSQVHEAPRGVVGDRVRAAHIWRRPQDPRQRRPRLIDVRSVGGARAVCAARTNRIGVVGGGAGGCSGS